MLPPIENNILQSNPRFAVLHANLAANILNPNGSTRYQSAQKDRDAVTEALRTTRIQAAKRQLIRTSLKNCDVNPSSRAGGEKSKVLPEELLEIILLLSAHLNSAPLSASQQKLLQNTSQWQSLPSHLPVISSLISTHLHSLALDLSRIHSPTTNASFLHRSIPKLLSSITNTQNSLADKSQALSKRRSDLTSRTSTVLAKYHIATALVIRLLESTMHGSVARHIKTKSEYLSLLAEDVKLETQEKKFQAEKMVYTKDVQNALQNYMENLRDGRERLKERKRQAERTLWGYGVGREDGEEKARVMGEIARVYGELIREVGEVGRDVVKLRGR